MRREGRGGERRGGEMRREGRGGERRRKHRDDTGTCKYWIEIMIVIVVVLVW